MKYVRTQALLENGNILDEVFTFPNKVNHDCMAECLKRLRTQTFGKWKRLPRHVVSAGFVNHEGKCYGKSESLGVESLPDDTKILNSQIGR